MRAGHAVVIGNSSGIGLALTRRLLAEGWTVTGVSRSPSPVSHDRYAHTVADVADADFRTALESAVDGRPVDVCVYAAGVGELLDLSDLPAQTRALEVNLIGAARAVEVVVPPMVAAGRGHLIGLSSLADAAVSPDAPGYAASKAGLSSYLQGLTLALRRHGVAVTTIRFGFVDTKMAKAPVKPMMMSAERAADVVMRAMRTRPAVVSYPRSIAAVVRGLRAVSAVQLRLGRPQ